MPQQHTRPTTGAASPPGRRRVWHDTQISQLTEGVLDDKRIQEALRSADSRGMTPAVYATLKTARRTEELIALLALLEPPQKEEAGQLDQILRLLERIAEAQVRIERRLGAVESGLAGWSRDSRPARPPDRDISQR